jgi:hypothetical protein
VIMATKCDRAYWLAAVLVGAVTIVVLATR